MADAMTGHEDWVRVRSVFEQCVSALEDETPFLPHVLPAFLAELLARVSVAYFGEEEQFIADALSVLSEGIEAGDDLFGRTYRDLRFAGLPEYAYTQPPGRRRRPTPFEAAVETARRLRDLSCIESLLVDITDAAVLGGSVSYGRFFNVKGAIGGSASDLDLLVVVESFDRLEKVCDRLVNLTGVDRASLVQFRLRVQEFQAYLLTRASSNDIVFSAKLAMYSAGDAVLTETDIVSEYNVSFHFVTELGFSRLVLADSRLVVRDEVGTHDLVYDFRESGAARIDHQRTFSGLNARLPIVNQQVGNSFVREVRIFTIDEAGRYFPGMFQNLILPSFDFRWGATLYRRRVESFRWKMVERLRHESRARPDELLRLSLAHTRSEVFAPHMIRNVDQSTVIS